MHIVNTISISLLLIASLMSCKKAESSSSSHLEISIIRKPQPSIVFKFSFDVDTSFYVDYKVFSKECYFNPSSGISQSLDDFHFKNSALIIENESGEFYNYSSTRHCKEYSYETTNCMDDWLRKISLRSREAFIDTIRVDCINDLKINLSDKNTRLHYVGIKGESLFGDQYESIVVKSNWIALP